MQDNSTSDSPARKKSPSGAEKRRRREAKGLPRLSPSEAAYEQRRSKPRRKAWYDKARSIIDTIKLERGCTDCGYRVHPAALEFDHLPGTQKLYTIASMTGFGSEAKLHAEIAKCEVVCANCHAIRTAERRRK